MKSEVICNKVSSIKDPYLLIHKKTKEIFFVVASSEIRQIGICINVGNNLKLRIGERSDCLNDFDYEMFTGEVILSNDKNEVNQ